jgi:hypothetical protein
MPLDKLQQLREKLGSASHNRLLTEVRGRPLLYWLARVDRELGEREKAGHA